MPASHGRERGPDLPLQRSRGRNRRGQATTDWQTEGRTEGRTEGLSCSVISTEIRSLERYIWPRFGARCRGRTVPAPPPLARSVQHAIARIDRKLQEDEHEKNTLGGGLTHSAEAEEESEMREGERQPSGSPMLCAIPLLALSLIMEGGSHEHEAGRRGNPL